MASDRKHKEEKIDRIKLLEYEKRLVIESKHAIMENEVLEL
jgi:hypothetical protein